MPSFRFGLTALLKTPVCNSQLRARQERDALLLQIEDAFTCYGKDSRRHKSPRTQPSLRRENSIYCRSAERRVGKESVSKCGSRLSTYHSKNKHEVLATYMN